MDNFEFLQFCKKAADDIRALRENEDLGAKLDSLLPTNDEILRRVGDKFSFSIPKKQTPADTSKPRSAASSKGNRSTIPMEVYGEEVSIDPANEPANVRIVNEQPTTDAHFIVEHIKRLQGYQKPQTVGPPDESRGRWVSLDEAAQIRNVSKDTLADYRTQGTKSEDGLSGIDSQGFHWRRSKLNAPTEYFIPSDSDRG